MSESRRDIAAVSVGRPYLAVVLNLLIVLGGLAVLIGLEVRELPNVDRPVIMVEAEYPGASPETVDAELTKPLEGAVARVSGVTGIEASSEEASTRIRVEFEPGKDMDAAAADVREATSRVEEDLPARMRKLTIVKSDANASPVIQVAIIPDLFDHVALSRQVENDIVPLFYAIPGVATVEMFGVRSRQMRVVLNPLQLNRYQLTITDIADALSRAPYDIPVGSYTSKAQELLVRARAPAVTADLIEEIVIRDSIRIGDVAEAYFAPATAQNFVRLNGEPAVGLGILRQANSNTVEIAEQVRTVVARLDQQYKDLTFVVTSDQSVFIESATSEVLKTLGLTTAVVIFSILLFFGKIRATVIPSLVIPASIIGSLIGFWIFGFSINLITLLALVLATGLIVDDAIVVLENIQRRQSLGDTNLLAAIVGTRQVFFAVLATTAVLIAVFIPISFLPSATGRLFREFGIVLAVAVAFSSFSALTLVPALAARLKLASDDKGMTFGLLTRIGNRILNVYVSLVRLVIKAPAVIVLVSLAIGGAVAFHLPSLTSELTPDEDRGEFQIFASGPDGVGIEYMQGQADAIEQVLLPLVEQGDIRTVYSVVGRWDPNRVISDITLSPWADRERTQDQIIRALKGPLSSIPGSRVNAFGRSSFETDWASRSGLSLDLLGNNYTEIHEAALILARAMEDASFEDVEISYNPTQPQMSLAIDRQSASDLGISLDDLSLTLTVMVGGHELVDLNMDDQAIPIILSAPTGLIQDPADLRNIYVTSDKGTAVPLSSLTTISQAGVAAELDRSAQRRAISVEAVQEDLPISTAIAKVSAIADEVLPEGIDYLMTGEADTFTETNRDLLLTYGFAILIVFLVLVAQFENLTSPLVVMAVVPFGLAATVGAMMVSGVTLNIFSQIGLVLLIGLMAKNGVLLVEFADQAQRDGKDRYEAILEAAKTRLRPISMTLLSTMIGSLPLILSSGAGSEARAAIGWTIFSGLGLSSMFALFLTPALYVLIARGARKPAARLVFKTS